MYKGEDIWAVLADTMSALHCAGVEIDWNEFNLPFEKSLRFLDLPTYAWNNKNYWIQYNGDWNLTKGNNTKTALPTVIRIYLGDVYIFEGETIIGMVGSIQFRRYPRILLSRFFSAPDESKTSAESPSTITTSRATKAATANHPPPAPMNKVLEPEPRLLQSHLEQQQPSPASKPTAMGTNITPIKLDSNSITARAIALIANEAVLELSELKDEASFAELGLDSLMSLVIAERFREQLQVTVRGSLFLEHPTVGDPKSWLQEYYE